MTLLRALALLLLSAGLAFAQSIPLPQQIGPPAVVNGIDASGNLIPHVVTQGDIATPNPQTASNSSVFFGGPQIQLGLDNPAGFVAGNIVFVQVYPEQDNFAYCVITAIDANGLMTCNITFIQGGGAVFGQFGVTVINGYTNTSAPPWAGQGVDGNTVVTFPAAAGATVNLTVEGGKSLFQNSIVYVYAINDPLNSWFMADVTSYDFVSGVLSLFATQVSTTGSTQQGYVVSLLAPNGPNAALIGYSATAIGSDLLQMTVSLPGSIISTSLASTGTSQPFTTQSSRYFPIDGQILATCLSSNTRLTGQVKAYSGNTLTLKITSTFNNASCSAWSLYLTTGPTTRISLYQQNGLQMTGVGGSTLTVNKGSIRDSTDTVDLTYNGGTFVFGGSIQSNSPQGAGTVTVTSPNPAVAGSGTAFSSFFSATATLTDLNNQLTALNLTTVTFPSVMTGIDAGTISGSVTTVTNNTTAAWNGTGYSVVGGRYYRGCCGAVFNYPVVYGALLARKDSDGTVGFFVTSFTPSGAPDLPSGYTYYRVIGYVVFGSASVSTIAVISQPLAANVLTTAGDIPYFGSVTTLGSTYQNYLQRLGIGSSGNVLEVSSGLPAWVSFATACTAATSSTFGCVKVDNSTITAAAGVITTANITVAGVACTPGSSCGLSKATNVLSGNVSLNNVANYFDGPSMAQGTSGTWIATGNATVSDTAGAAAIECKLWDGTTVISSTRVQIAAANGRQNVALSGYLASPAANIRISCKDITSTSGVIIFNDSGNSADSTIWGVRIN